MDTPWRRRQIPTPGQETEHFPTSGGSTLPRSANQRWPHVDRPRTMATARAFARTSAQPKTASRSPHTRGVSISARLPRGGCFAPRFLDDPNARARADAGRAGGHHGLHLLEIADAARGLHAHLVTDNATHQRYI